MVSTRRMTDCSLVLCNLVKRKETMSPSNEATLDQLFAEPIVKQLMRRDRIDEATIRHLLRQAAVVRAVPRVEGLLALVMGLPLPAGIRYAWDIAVRTRALNRCRDSRCAALSRK